MVSSRADILIQSMLANANEVIGNGMSLVIMHPNTSKLLGQEMTTMTYLFTSRLRKSKTYSAQ